MTPATLSGATEAVIYSASPKPGRCRKGTVTATGSFTTNGTGGLVSYEWIRTDNRGSVVVSEPPLTITAGDAASHSVAPDSWTPNSTGTEQLVFLSTGAPSLVAQAFTCR